MAGCSRLLKGPGWRQKQKQKQKQKAERQESLSAEEVVIPTPLFGAIEAGGTKFVCLCGTGPDDVRDEARFLTTTPEVTLGRAVEFLAEAQRRFGPMAAIGVGSFGPVDLHRQSTGFGRITSTPKPQWADVDVVGHFRRAFEVPIAFDTDVNAAALGEWRWGAGQGLETFVYLTIGTGIGGGAMVNGRLLHGLVHPEMGHMRVPHDVLADAFAGCCPFHGDCLEGLASGPAVAERWGTDGEHLPGDHPAWPLEAHYLSVALVNVISVLSPQRIVLGGGVMRRAHLLPLIRERVVALLAGYSPAATIADDIDRYIVPAQLAQNAGVLGAMALAAREMSGVRGQWSVVSREQGAESG